MMRCALLLFVPLLLFGCRAMFPAYSYADLEIAKDPTVLYRRQDDSENMHLHGVRMGDPAGDVLKKRIVSRNDVGWVELRNAARYLIQDNQVTGLGVWDQRLLLRLGINSPADIESKFGKPESIDDLGKEKIYRYQHDHLRVMWNEFERRVTTVNIVQ